MRHLHIVPLLFGAVSGADLQVIEMTPARHALDASAEAEIALTFDAPVDRASIEASCRIFGTSSGPASGTFRYEAGDTRVVFDANERFLPGEVVSVSLSNGARASSGEAIRQGGYVQRFRIESAEASLEFEHIETLTTRDTPQRTRIYGGQATDVDDDGSADLVIISEDTADVRVYLNRADGSGTFEDFLGPFDTDALPSPNHPADFNDDGFVDIATCNVIGSSVSVLLGAGDGTFTTLPDVVSVGTPHGLAVLDIDGDGDTDLATANTGIGLVRIYTNDGTGVMTLDHSFDGGGSGEYALASADMNEDGIDDLIVGTRDSQRATIFVGNGDGTFTQAGQRSVGGRCWMFVVGDVNGDGHMDLSSANSDSGTGSILLGDGAGNLGPAATYAAPGFDTATDLGDLDGDGDLDWVVSSFGGNEWRLFVNDGTGTFALQELFPASANPGCAIMTDVDDDLDLDLVLLDEIDDLIILMRNTNPCLVDLNEDGTIDVFDVLFFVGLFDSGHPASDWNGDTVQDIFDVLDFLGDFEAGC